MDMESNMLSEISQAQKAKYCMVLFYAESITKMRHEHKRGTMGEGRDSARGGNTGY
jgi:hypothetical protein